LSGAPSSVKGALSGRVGLAAGPMGGFDTAGLDAEFFPSGNWSFLIVNIGYCGQSPWYERLPR